MSQPPPQALIADDGELGDVRDALTALGVRFADAEAADPGDEIPLLLTTTSRAPRRAAAGSPGPRHLLHVVVAEAGAQGLDRVPCDFLLQRPVSKELLRLLVERAGYVGPERRRTTRVALGVPVSLRIGDAERQAILAQLSVGGCGLVTGFPLEVDAPVRLALPQDLTGRRRLAIDGTVLSSRPTRTGDGATFDVSVVFGALALSDRVTLRALMAGQPIDFRPESRLPRAVRGQAPRRGARRRPVAGRSGVARVVIGRDLSATGMRIELDPGLAAGDALELALYGSRNAEAVVLRGRTERDPEEDAWRVHFEDLGEHDARAIEALRSSCAADRAGFVIAEILERSEPR